MAWSWKILQSAVEQEILFPSEKCYEDYLALLKTKNEPYRIVSQKKQQDGTMIVVMRKRYNNTKFMK